MHPKSIHSKSLMSLGLILSDILWIVSIHYGVYLFTAWTPSKVLLGMNNRKYKVHWNLNKTRYYDGDGFSKYKKF